MSLLPTLAPSRDEVRVRNLEHLIAAIERQALANAVRKMRDPLLTRALRVEQAMSVLTHAAERSARTEEQRRQVLRAVQRGRFARLACLVASVRQASPDVTQPG